MPTKCPKCQLDNSADSKFCKECGTSLYLHDAVPVSITKTLISPAAEGSMVAGRYRILDKLGEGGMGVVYKAEDIRLKRIVALKFMPPELTRDSEAKERFIREAQAAAALSHPNICTIHEVDEADGQSFISMEYVEGQSVREKIKKGPLDTAEALGIAIQAAQGLEEAHKKGIVHRDIKSANIMVTGSGQAKVMDFGLAKVFGASLITKEAKTMGTVAYMSPEQAQGQNVDHRTDIWSYGVVLYEIVTGELPFKGENDASLMYSIVHEKQKPVRSIKPDIPAEFEQIISRALEKDPDYRFQSPAEILKELIEFQNILRAEEAGILNIRSFLRRIRKPRIAIPLFLTIIVICLVAIWYLNKSAKTKWVRMQAIPEINRHTEEGNFLAAFQLAQRAERIIPNDPMLTSFWPLISREGFWKTNPPGAALYIRELNGPEEGWEYLGRLSGQQIRIPKGCYQARIEKDGYETILCLFRTDSAEYYFQNKLNQLGSISPNMSVVPAGEKFVELNLYHYDRLLTCPIGEFLIDKYEVTNREFKEFIDEGGYERREYWKHEFTIDGRIISWEVAVEAFRDKTGRPGPGTWEFGSYHEGQADYPVTGVSWYEAAAYAEFKNKRLPTIYHWDRAARLGYSSGWIVPTSNIGGSGLAPVASYSGSLGINGTYDMIGNAREWCSNATGDMRFTLGGAWNDPSYFAVEPNVRPPFDRAPENGFRCMKLMGEASTSEEIERPLTRIQAVDWSKEKPFSDDVFNMWLSFVSYPELDLNPVVEFVDDTSMHWRIEKVSFDTAYDKERMLAYLFLPKNVSPPFQAVIWWPGAYAAFLTDSQNGNFNDLNWWDYYIKDGRAVLYPVLQGTYERGGNPSKSLVQIIDQVLFERNTNIKQVKDLRRCIDYLESREDIDSEKVAYCGFSWGAHMGSFPCSAEKRIKAGIFISGCLFNRDIFGWAHRVKTPILMINGRYDSTFPYETSQRPLFNALATPPEHKVHNVYDADHVLSGYVNEMIKANLEWLDRYLGPVNR